MIQRIAAEAQVKDLLERYPVVVLLGARQIGKTTLARTLTDNFDGPVTFFDLEDPRDRAKLEQPMLSLEPPSGLVVIDEVQLRPELFSVVRVLADRPRRPTRFLLLGSASPHVVRGVSESLAGRAGYVELDGFGLDEAGPSEWRKLWLRGGFPVAFLAAGERQSYDWRRNLVRSYVERDLQSIGIDLAPETMRRFLSMMAHYHGDVWNASELARAFGVSDKTVRRYLDILVGTFLVRRLDPWHGNPGKRLVKAPKTYLSDSGILHALQGIHDADDLAGHPKVGASFEGFALALVARRLGAQREECFFWATYQGAELDLLVVHGKRRLGFEFKYTATPKMTKSMRSAMEELNLSRLTVVHAGPDTFLLDRNVTAVAIGRLLEDIRPLDERLDLPKQAEGPADA